jgi:methylenetetrahydrofolate reductase (NADPH)
VAAEGFHYFRPGGNGELNGDQPADLSPRHRRRHPLYVLSYAVDYVAFGSLLPPFRFLAALCRFCDKGPVRRRALWTWEFLAKGPLYGCRMCGDCTLYACAFLCAEAGCPKRMNNGPCGGSRDGWCEVHPGKKTCFWVSAYGRLKGLAERPDFPTPPIPAKDRGLQGTCSWINFCLGRDHRRAWVRRRLAGR